MTQTTPPLPWDSEEPQPWLHIVEDYDTHMRYSVVLVGTYCGTANLAQRYVAARLAAVPARAGGAAVVPESRLSIVHSGQVGDVMVAWADIQVTRRFDVVRAPAKD